MNASDKIYVAGHRGMVGSAVCRALAKQGYTNVVTRTHKELDLLDPAAVAAFYAAEKPDVAVICAARVGGIGANSAANALFLYENEMIALNTVWGAYKAGVKRLLFLGSTCIYPRMAPQPIPESALLTSELEKTNEGYALAKIAGLKYCAYLNRQHGADYVSVMPTNLYGPNDNYHPEHSHVLPALIRRFHEAKEAKAPFVTCWGDGSPLREFLYVDDLADLCLLVMERYHGDDPINAGSGREITIKALSELVARTVGYEGEIRWDRTRPNGTPRKLLDLSRSIALGWKPKTSLEDGLKLAYRDFLENPMRVER